MSPWQNGGCRKAERKESGRKKGSEREEIMRMGKKERKETTQTHCNIFTASASFRKPHFKAFYVFSFNRVIFQFEKEMKGKAGVCWNI